MVTRPVAVCYPEAIDVIRYVPVPTAARRREGDVAQFYDEHEARARYDELKSLTVAPVSALEQRPPWFLYVRTPRGQYKITHITPGGGMLRTMDWKREPWAREDGLLTCLEVVDVFYPDGEPTHWIPLSRALTVTRRWSTDGLMRITLSGPMLEHDEVREATDLDPAQYTSPAPEFDDLAAWASGTAPDDTGRYGDTAIDAARAFFDAQAVMRASGLDAGRSGEWTTSVSVREIMDVVDALDSGDVTRAPRATTPDIPILARGAANIMPLIAQKTAPHDEADAAALAQRLQTLAADVDGACEHRAGRGVPIDLDDESHDSVGTYSRALMAVGATDARYWIVATGIGVVLVWSGLIEHGDRALAIHLVPASWVSERCAEGPVAGIDVTWSWDDLSGAGMPSATADPVIRDR